MPVEVNCKACQHTLKIPDEIFERRVKGRVAVLNCKRCKTPIEIDGREVGSEASPPARALEAAPEASRTEAETHPPQEPVPRVVEPQAVAEEAPKLALADAQPVKPEVAEVEPAPPLPQPGPRRGSSDTARGSRPDVGKAPAVR